MTRRQSNNQRSGDIAAHPAPENSVCKNPLENFSPRFFWDQDGILLIDYLPKGQTINVEYYSSLLVQLKDILKEKRRGKVTKGVLFLHDNAPAHGALATQKKLAYLGFQLLDHPPYSPDLTTSDYHLFPGLKKQLRGRHFSSDAEVIAARRPGWADNFLIFFLGGLQKLEQRDKKCIDLRGEYVEEILSLVAVACFHPGRAKDLSAPPPLLVLLFIQHNGDVSPEENVLLNVAYTCAPVGFRYQGRFHS